MPMDAWRRFPQGRASAWIARSRRSCVLQNHLHHRPSRHWVDECSSGRWFTGWKDPLSPPLTPSPVQAPLTWLLSTGWKRHGLIDFTEGPA